MTPHLAQPPPIRSRASSGPTRIPTRPTSRSSPRAKPDSQRPSAASKQDDSLTLELARRVRGEAQLLGDANRWCVVVIDDALELLPEMRVAPCERSAHRFGRVALAVVRAGEHPAALDRGELGRHVAPIVHEADLADELALAVAHHPHAEAEQDPVARVPLDARPGLFLAARLATDVFVDLGRAPHRVRVLEVGKRRPAKYKSFGFEDRNHRRTRNATRPRMPSTASTSAGTRPGAR